MLKTNKGFSLIELMVVVAIIGILASVAVPNFQKFQKRAKASEGKSHLSAVFMAMEAFKSEWDSYSGGFQEIGFDPKGSMLYYIVNGAVVAPASANYVAPNPNRLNSNAYCGDSGNCTSPATAPLAAAAATAAGTFTVDASAQLDGDGAIDHWTINQAKVLNKVVDDVNQ